MRIRKDQFECGCTKKDEVEMGKKEKEILKLHHSIVFIFATTKEKEYQTTGESAFLINPATTEMSTSHSTQVTEYNFWLPREQIKLIKSKYQKTRDQNCTSGKSPTSCLFYEDFDQVLGTVHGTNVVHNDLESWDGTLLAPESSMGTDGSQQKEPSEDNEMTLLLKPVPQEALLQEQQQHTYSESF
ncbi:hypothetical protein KIL84_007261 [Mauremys mutica]|uniref:Uncharacterized protein n=1 Tax=Mauremys mutica TaxID=74926 RepID=A0A9D4AUW7_9SAUR|nr:hypothetical protein KIL84_007261 [Mauremys mutica]